MLNFSQLEQIHLEISNNCQASCPMCSRNVNGGQENPLVKINNWSLDNFKTVMSPEVLNQIRMFYLCGTFGDPMMNNDMIDMCRYSKEINPNIDIHIHTNGGARKPEWWEELAQALPKKHRVVFGIDGLEDTHHLYRVGTNFETVIKNATAFINAGGIAEWAFIKFKHNEHQVNEAESMAKELGFATFNLKSSSRFIIEPKVKVVNREGNITHYIEPSTDNVLKFIDKKTIEKYKLIVEASKIDCQVKKTKEVYVDAFGDLYACCWLANAPYTHISDDAAFEVRTKMKEQNSRMMQYLGEVNTFKRSIRDIIDSKEYQSMWSWMWNGPDKNIICSRSCGIQNEAEFSKNTDQFIETRQLND